MPTGDYFLPPQGRLGSASEGVPAAQGPVFLHGPKVPLQPPLRRAGERRRMGWDGIVQPTLMWMSEGDYADLQQRRGDGQD